MVRQLFNEARLARGNKMVHRSPELPDANGPRWVLATRRFRLELCNP